MKNDTMPPAAKNSTESVAENRTETSVNARISADSPAWWEQMLTRRSATKSLASLAAMAGVSGFITACDDDDEEQDKDVLEIQKTEGWNVGSTDKTLTFPNKQDSDSMRSTNWREMAKPSTLMQAWQPTDEAWKPYFVPTLIQSLSQPSLQTALVPVCSPAMREAYSRGLGMRELLKNSTNPKETLVLADLPGPEAVAFAAAVADVATPVLSFDNWPHPLGVVQSHLTLAALVYFANEVKEKAAKRPKGAPALVVLDGNRLANYVDADNQFDNRYMAKVPTAENLSALGIKSLLYATPNESKTTETDDLNDDFATFQEKNIAINLLPVSRFQVAPPNTAQNTAQAASNMASTTGTTSVSTAIAKAPQTTPMNAQQNLQAQNQNPQQNSQQAQMQQQYANTSGSYVSYAPVYYYGGSPFHSAWFYYHYPVYSYYRPMPMVSRLPSTMYSRPSYSAVRRPTMFSASRVGASAARGIGKQRPSGFGRVTVRTNSSTGRVSGVRAGRSGSFSGSRSGSFGRSSFGGRSS